MVPQLFFPCCACPSLSHGTPGMLSLYTLNFSHFLCVQVINKKLGTVSYHFGGKVWKAAHNEDGALVLELNVGAFSEVGRGWLRHPK